MVVDLTAALNAVSDLIGAPVILEDCSFRVIGYSDGHEWSDPQRREAILHRRAERFSTMWLPDVYEAIRRGDHVAYQPGVEDGMLPRAAVGVMDGDRPLGAIWAMVREPLTPERAELFLAAARAVAVTMVRMRASEAAIDSRAELLAAVLEARPGVGLEPGPFELHGARLSVVGLHVVGADGPNAGRRRHRAAEAFAVHASGSSTHFDITIIGEVVYIAVGTAVDDDIAHLARVRDIATRFADGAREPVLMGLGRAVRSVNQLAVSRADADRVLRVTASRGVLGSSVAEPQDVYLELAIDRLADLTTSGILPVPAGLAALAAHDARHEVKLCEALSICLDSFGNARAAAERMHVHVTTVRYRLRRIAEIARLDLDDPRQRLEAAVGLRVLERAGT